MTAADGTMDDSPTTGGERAATFPRRLPLTLGALGFLVWALVLYRPWLRVPFEVQDFSEMLPLLRAGASFGARHAALSRYYAEHGRYFPLTLLFTNLKWTLFGPRAADWQWVEVALMLLSTALAFRLLRRFGASSLGAAAGAAAYVVSASTALLWARVHLSEPEGIPFLLGAALVAARAERQDFSWRNSLAVALLLALAVLVKETFVAALPFVVLVGLCYDGRGGWHPPVARRGAALRWVAVIGSVCAVVLVPILVTKLGAKPTGYATRYTAANMSARNAVVTARTMFLPMSDSVHRWFPELAFLAIVAIGLAAWRRGRRDWIWMTIAALSLPLGGTLVHLSWYMHPPRYASSYLLGLAMLLAYAVTGIELAPRRTRLIAYALLGFLGLYGTFRAHEQVDDFLAVRRARQDLLRVLDSASVAAATSRITVASDQAQGECLLCRSIVSDRGELAPGRVYETVIVPCDRLPDLARGDAPTAIAAAESDDCGTERRVRPRPATEVLQVARHDFSGPVGPPDTVTIGLWSAASTSPAARVRR